MYIYTCIQALAGLLNYLVFLSAAVNSPLTTSITGQAKNVVSSLGGYLLLPTSAGVYVYIHIHIHIYTDYMHIYINHMSS